MFDLVALMAIAVGAVLCLVSNLRLKELAKLSYQHPGPRSESALAAADKARYLAYGGVGLIAVGCISGVAGALYLMRSKRAAR